MVDVDGLEWVTEEQALQLAHEWGDGWPELLRAQLDARYPGWEYADDQDRQDWLTALIAVPAEADGTGDTGSTDGTDGTDGTGGAYDTGGTYGAYDTGGAYDTDDTGDPAALGWLSAEQQAQLGEQWELRGDWREWLPAELDGLWPQWRQSTPDVLGPWLDTLIPGLVLPFGADHLLEHVARPALAELYAALPAMAEELGTTTEELRAEVDALPGEFFTQIILEETGAG